MYEYADDLIKGQCDHNRSIDVEEIVTNGPGA